MHGRSGIKIPVLVLIFFMLLNKNINCAKDNTPVSSFSKILKKIKDSKVKIFQISKEKERKKENLKKEKQKQKDLKASIYENEAAVNVLNISIPVLKSQIRDNEKQIKILEKKKASIIESLMKILRSIYKRKVPDLLEIIFNSDISNFSEKVKILNFINKKLQRMIKELEQSRANIKAIEFKNKTLLAKVENDKIARKSKIEKLEELYKSSTELQSQIQNEIDEEDEELKKIENEVKKYYESIKDIKNESSNNFVLFWPVKGFRHISSGFNDVRSGGKLHGAIDISGTYGKNIYGAKVRSPVNGRVVVASMGWNGGYGNVVVIHFKTGNEDYFVRLAHLSIIMVNSGQYVVAKEPIGYVGNSGISTGPHLHYEIEKRECNKSWYKVNPLSYPHNYD